MHNRVWSDAVYGFGLSCGWFGPLLTMVLWGLAIAGAVFIVKSLFSGRAANSVRSESPLEVLKRRYAGGEIDREEFMKRKGDLGF